MPDLFGPIPSLDGLTYVEDFLSPEAERALVGWIAGQPLEAARYKQYTARRRVMSFGGSFDYDANRLRPAQPLAPELFGLRDDVARLAGVPPESLVHALVAEYAPGTPLGWHRDVPDFELIAGVSLGSTATLRFRRYPPSPQTNRQTLSLEVAPRSAYVMRGEARWGWQHSVVATPELRWSVTFRTARAGAAPIAGR